MSDQMCDPLLERIGPVVLRVLALASAAVITVPLALMVVLPFFG